MWKQALRKTGPYRLGFSKLEEVSKSFGGRPEWLQTLMALTLLVYPELVSKSLRLTRKGIPPSTRPNVTS